MRNLSKEIATLKEALADATDDLIIAQTNLDNDRTDWGERWIENVYFNLFMLSQRSEKLKASLAEGERKAAEKLKVKYPTYSEGRMKENLSSSVYVNVKEICELLGISRSTVYKLINQGVFPEPIRLGRACRWKVQSVLDWVDSQQKEQEE